MSGDRCSKCGATDTEVFVRSKGTQPPSRLRVPYVAGVSESMVDERNKAILDGYHPLTFVLGWQTYVSWLHELGCHAHLHTSPVTREVDGGISSFMHVPVAVDHELRHGVRVLVKQWESVGYARDERRKFEPTALVLEEEERQMLLKALADLSRVNPGWDDALNRIALRMDNDARGRAEMYEGFRELSRARPPAFGNLPTQFFQSATHPGVVVGVDRAIDPAADCTSVGIFERTEGGTLVLRDSVTWKGQEVRVGDDGGGYALVDLAPLAGAELDAFAERYGVISREDIRKANDQTLPRAAPHGLDSDEQYRWRVMQALRAEYVRAKKLLERR